MYCNKTNIDNIHLLLTYLSVLVKNGFAMERDEINLT